MKTLTSDFRSDFLGPVARTAADGGAVDARDVTDVMSEADVTSGFDGIICIGGEDWWYHNRGHFDFQVMRRLATQWPVLFVNSLGVRMPSVRHDKMFAARIGRKFKSLTRGVVQVEPGFWVFSPVNIPGRLGQAATQWALAPQIRLAARRAGIRRPVLWIHCPAGAPLAEQIPSQAVVMQRTDRFEAFPEADGAVVAGQIQDLKARADLVVYAAPHLQDEERDHVKRSLLITHGVDLDRFVQADTHRVLPSDMVDIAASGAPRIGFVGGIDRHTFDPDLFVSLAGACPQWQFVMVGGCSLPDGWCPHRNVSFLGRKPYDAVAHYMAAMDVLIMPWNDSPWIQACNPIKLKEYLAVGRPVVTRDFAALDGWRDVVRVADTADGFAQQIAASLQAGGQDVRARLVTETWDAKTDALAQVLRDVASG